MCVSNRVEQFPAGYFRAGSASQAAEAPEAAGPKCCAERSPAPRSIDRPHERTQTRALMREGLLDPGAVTVGMTVPLSLLKARATFALRKL